MSILVQKFGGTSLSNEFARSHVIKHIKRAVEQKYKLVVIVSAMGRKGEPYATDTLLDLIKKNGNQLPPKETDLLLGCGEIISASIICSLLNDHSISSEVLTGAQAGILTNNHHNKALIKSIQPKRILQLLDQNKVIIITGFQGCNEAGDLTTLGRGGSDTSATAVASALNAEMVDIFTDVDGILTADPRIVEDAKPLKKVSYIEICNMAQYGAKVVHPRAVEIAMHSNIPLRVRSTFSEDEGTLVTNTETLHEESVVHDRLVTGITHVPHVSQIHITASQGQYDLQLKVFKAMAHHQISVDLINVTPSGVMYTVFDHEIEKAISILRDLGYDPFYQSKCAKVSVIGGGINGVPGIMAKIVEALTETDIQILQSADSNTTIWVLVHAEYVKKALKSLHKKFNLHK
ncbi:aspartate kinase [Chengkuizengella axinellae]|uniref:Aspartokinase n=1 Tax=Chengkuizengella axinellae TaxID=3064388 RepID=A0ABT9IWM3_9BACL|nr:aspartate kinase [Chengkuizengella sp. 2205SS18-9]MDP5273497.1 aspartate kinase [Chengkuizengella sp. 2205SS18-9]